MTPSPAQPCGLAGSTSSRLSSPLVFWHSKQNWIAWRFQRQVPVALVGLVSRFYVVILCMLPIVGVWWFIDALGCSLYPGCSFSLWLSRLSVLFPTFNCVFLRHFSPVFSTDIYLTSYRSIWLSHSTMSAYQIYKAHTITQEFSLSLSSVVLGRFFVSTLVFLCASSQSCDPACFFRFSIFGCMSS